MTYHNPELPSYWSSRRIGDARWPREIRQRTAELLPVPGPSRNGTAPTPSRRVSGITTTGRVQRIEDRSPAEQARMDRLVADSLAFVRSLRRS
jgi:hypothetical protein